MMETMDVAEAAVPAHETEAGRVRLASRGTTAPETLHRLAADPSLTVRAAVAINPTFALDANLRLVHDTDERVRMLLASKVARLLPGLSGPEHEAAQTHVSRMLMILADDAAVRVRVALTEALTTMPEAPREVILKLAHDPAAPVSDPVVRLSPLLTDADLLDLLATPPHPGSAQAIASRDGLSARVADHLATHASSAAVSALLSNNSATIQEATLDALIGRAADHPEWHEPLVRRPWLPARAISALSRLVAGQLLDALLTRTDVTPGLADALRVRIDHSLTAVPDALPSAAERLEGARRLYNAGRLEEPALLEAAASGDHQAAAALLSVASGVTLETIDRAIALRSAKGLVSLVGRAGFTMRAGTAMQIVLGRLGPSEILAQAPDGSFPLSAAEMDWQIELLGEPGH